MQTAIGAYILALAFEYFANGIATIKKANHKGQLTRLTIPSDV